MMKTILAPLAMMLILTCPALAQDKLHRDLIRSISTATSSADITREIARTTGPVVAQICSHDRWDDISAALEAQTGLFDAFSLHPTIDRAEQDGMVRFFAWGPDISDAVERLNPDLGYVSLHFWITVELLDWGTHHTLRCDYAAWDASDDRYVLATVRDGFLQALPQLEKTATHTAPMLHQPPDRIDLDIYQSQDGRITLAARMASDRVDVTFVRRIAR